MTYLFSGLGADRRVFVNMNLPDKHTFIQWISPLKNESLSAYVDRIIKQQINLQEEVKIIGLSFGGIVGIEVAKKLGLKEITIIASAKTYHEIPFIYRFIGSLGIDKLIPTILLKWSNPLTNYLFGLSTVEDKRLLKAILKDTDNRFLKWAIRKIVTWKNEESIENTLHIHGTKDWILWHSCVRDAVLIIGGGHLMILNRSKEVNEIIKTC